MFIQFSNRSQYSNSKLGHNHNDKSALCRRVTQVNGCAYLHKYMMHRMSYERITKTSNGDRWLFRMAVRTRPHCVFVQFHLNGWLEHVVFLSKYCCCSHQYILPVTRWYIWKEHNYRKHYSLAMEAIKDNSIEKTIYIVIQPYQQQAVAILALSWLDFLKHWTWAHTVGLWPRVWQAPIHKLVSYNCFHFKQVVWSW